ncbi:MAG TPA: glutamine amidotransferase [Polyangiales bacterium]
MSEVVAPDSLKLGAPFGSVVALLLMAALVAIVVLGLREHQSLADPRKRWVLHVLRLLTGIAAALLMFQPRWLGQTVEQVQGRVAVLLDTSRSMSVQAGSASRLAQAQSVLGPALDAAGDKPSLFAFGDELTSLSRAALADPQLPLADDTRIEHALRELAQTQNAGLGAIVLVTDGADRSPGLTASTLASLGVRVHTVLVADTAALSDVSIQSLHADPVAFLHQPAQVEVSLRAPAGHTSPILVTLRSGTEVVREVSAELAADGTATLTIPFTPTRIGRAAYTVSIPTDENDAVPANNERAFVVRVVRERLRVLLVCGQPSWDARFLRGFLKGNPSIDLITFFILRTQTDNSMASPEELSLIPFPTQELFEQHLASFDLVIFQNFDFGPYQMAQYLPRIHDYVVNGGSFAMLGGDRSFGAGGYVGTPLADILPVRLLAGEHAMDLAELSPQVVADSTHHPVVELLPHAADNVAAWRDAAPLLGSNRVLGLREGAQALLVHPTLTGDGGDPMPVLAVGAAGRGRSLALTTDTSYRWSITTAGRSGDASVYERFWDRALRWLARDPLLDPAQITTDREQYGPGAKLRVHVWLRDEHYRALGPATFRLTLADAHGRSLQQLAIETDADGKAELSLAAPSEPGAYLLSVQREGQSEALASEWLVVEVGGDELADPRANPPLLRAIARATGGNYYERLSDLPLLDALPRTRTHVLSVTARTPFDSAWFFALAVGLFACEWWLRRRFGLR